MFFGINLEEWDSAKVYIFFKLSCKDISSALNSSAISSEELSDGYNSTVGTVIPSSSLRKG